MLEAEAAQWLIGLLGTQFGLLGISIWSAPFVYYCTNVNIPCSSEILSQYPGLIPV